MMIMCNYKIRRQSSLIMTMSLSLQAGSTIFEYGNPVCFQSDMLDWNAKTAFKLKP